MAPKTPRLPTKYIERLVEDAEHLDRMGEHELAGRLRLTAARFQEVSSAIDQTQ